MPHMNTDPWVWRVEYADGSTLDEYDADTPDGHGWADALNAQTRITRVLLIPQRDALHTHVVTLTSDTASASVRIFRRRSVTVSGETGEQTIGPSSDPITVIALGEGCYTFLFADGSLVVSDDLNAV